jgi:hypothetical protein
MKTPWVILQGVVTIIATTVPTWLDRAVTSESTYSYLLDPPYVWQLSGLTVAVIFSPQIASFLMAMLGRAVSQTFYASYQLFNRRRYRAIFHLPTILVFFIGFTSFIHGIVTYGASVVREVKYHEEISRQNLVKKVNEEAQKGGEASSDTLQRILTLYPGDVRNARVEKRLNSIKASKTTSANLMAKSEQFAAKKQDRLAIEFTRAALDVWPYNQDAKKSLERYRETFSSMRPAIQDIHTYCNSDTTANLLDLVSKAGLMFRDVTSIMKVIETRQDAIGVQRIRSQVCSEASKVSDPAQFIADMKRELFGEEI